MGSLQAAEFALATTRGELSIESAVSWHLSSNHYPPVPAAFVKSCVAAIEAGQDEDWDLDIPLPKGCNTHHTLLAFDADDCGREDCDVLQAVEWKDGRGVARAGDLIESFHLDSFL